MFLPQEIAQPIPLVFVIISLATTVAFLFHKFVTAVCTCLFTLVCVLVVEKGKLLQHLDISPRFSVRSAFYPITYICRDKLGG